MFINEQLQAMQDAPKITRGYQAFQQLTAGVARILFAEETKRTYLLVQNRGGANVYLTFGQAPQGASLNYPSAILLTAGSSYEIKDPAIADTVYVVADGVAIVSAIQGIASIT